MNILERRGAFKESAPPLQASPPLKPFADKRDRPAAMQWSVSFVANAARSSGVCFFISRIKLRIKSPMSDEAVA